MPITCYGTGATRLLWLASSLMEHFWHRRDLSSKHLTLRPTDHVAPGGVLRGKCWGPPVQTGPSIVVNARSDIRFQGRVLQEEQPAYLLSLPSNLRALAEFCREQAVTLSGLKGVRSYGEVLTPEIRQFCEETWGVQITDVYSSQEVGNMAFQCPEQGRLHVFADGVLLEVLRDDGTPCQPGETGQVVATPLVNYGFPLIRYAVGDYAEPGGDCSCGRHTPVLTRVHGRQRNMLHIPGGGRIWPSFSVKSWVKELPIIQFQFVQKSLDGIEARLVTARPLTAPEEAQLIEALHERLGYPFRIELTYLDGIPRSKSGKYEDFISELG
jgi:phenylacetate-CoA ligase